MLLLTLKSKILYTFFENTKYCLDPEPKFFKVGTGTAINHQGSTTLHKRISEINKVMCRIPDVALPGLGDAGHGPQLLHLAEERGQARV
jgi:hypothetical protein